MFLLNSWLNQFTETVKDGTLYPEVTALICLVPSPRLTRAPENTHLDYLCRFTVRAVLA